MTMSLFWSLCWKAKWRGNCEVGLGRNVSKRISNQLQGKNHNVYFDNYFNSVQLHKELNEVRMYGCGTVWTNSKGLPEAMWAKRGDARPPVLKINPGEYKLWQKGAITACTMQEKAKRKPLKMLSSNTISMEPKTAVKPKQHNGFSMEIPCLSPWNCITKIWMVWIVAIKCEQTFHLPECKGNCGHYRCGFS